MLPVTEGTVTNRRFAFVCAYCVGVALGGCEVSSDETEEEVGAASDAITYLTPVKFMAANGYTKFQAPIGTQNTAIVAAYGNASNRYILALRSKTSSTINLHSINAQPGDAQFGNVIASAGTPHYAGNVRDAATLRQSSAVDYAMIAYQGQHEGSGGFYGHRFVRVLRVTSLLGHASYLIRDCNDASGQLFCRTNAPSIAASTRNDGTDKALVLYVLQPGALVNHVSVEAAFISPSGAVTNLASLPACATPPCQQAYYPPETETAYNRLANRFLSVWALPSATPGSPINFRGQIFHGTTGAPIGGVINFGNHDVLGAPNLGVASNPDAADNPGMKWALMIENVVYDVAPDGTFSQVALPAIAQNMESFYTLQAANGFSTGKEYEYIASDWDANGASPLKLWKFDAALSSWESFDVANGALNTYGEGMSYSLRTTNEIAVWSGPADTGAQEGYINWRIIRR